MQHQPNNSSAAAATTNGHGTANGASSVHKGPRPDALNRGPTTRSSKDGSTSQGNCRNTAGICDRFNTYVGILELSLPLQSGLVVISVTTRCLYQPRRFVIMSTPYLFHTLVSACIVCTVL